MVYLVDVHFDTSPMGLPMAQAHGQEDVSTNAHRYEKLISECTCAHTRNCTYIYSIHTKTLTHPCYCRTCVCCGSYVPPLGIRESQCDRTEKIASYRQSWYELCWHALLGLTNGGGKRPTCFSTYCHLQKNCGVFMFSIISFAKGVCAYPKGYANLMAFLTLEV